MYVRRERSVVLTDKGRAVLELLRQQAALQADDQAGREQLEREISALIAMSTV